jgi:hypothetical protein
MNTQHKKNKITIVVIFALSIIPFGFAWYLAEHPQALSLGKSNGDLITPPITTQVSDYTGYDRFSSENLTEIPGHWILLNVVTQPDCTAVCNDALYKSKQLSLMLGKDISRVRRVAAFYLSSTPVVLSQEWQDDGHLLKIILNPSLQEKIQHLLASSAAEGSLVLMDPLGNLMMKYPAGYDPYKVKNDLGKLLRISQIG